MLSRVRGVKQTTARVVPYNRCMKDFGRLLRDIRRQRGESLVNVAERAGLSFSQLAKRERDESPTAVQDLEQLGEAYGCEFHIIVHGDVRPKGALSAEQDAARAAFDRTIASMSDEQAEALKVLLDSVRTYPHTDCIQK